MLIRDVRRSGRWFPESGCILEHQIFRFAKMILRDRCSTSYDPFTTILRLLSAPVVLGNLFLGTLLGNLFLGTRYPTLRRADLAAPRDSLGKGDPSTEPGSQRIWLLRPAPEPLLWLKTRTEAYAVGEKCSKPPTSLILGWWDYSFLPTFGVGTLVTAHQSSALSCTCAFTWYVWRALRMTCPKHQKDRDQLVEIMEHQWTSSRRNI